ncbi:NAD(P)H-dependent oxidoreductase [Halopseudomonas salegens]|uniref:Putative NADPH-quinone reductase (Modulator of drug activity B) n=1 Tax=Halopseudomonas salegens TaxID=1434072 RepID=A0A1H2G2V4_9GAMM|nr:NAD(P)H-dependent oxidoreductase [Halopseudomonas salegens]SDU13956.1 Putative NADPH-quinone reductase (modulator of drug activity B) [Halopseudomonas salegens]
MGDRRILLVVGHPSAQSYGSALAEAYAEEAIRSGHQVRWLRLDQLAFDPLLHDGYRSEQVLEPDLQAAQDWMLWADHLVFVYPVWWGSTPALMKGFLDRTFLPGFAFRYVADKQFPQQLLKGRSAHLLITMDTPPWYFRWVYGAPAVRQMKVTTLEFCGIRPVRSLLMGPILGSTPAQRDRWLRKARALAAQL